MALINCPECNTEVSERAPMCVKCGFPISSLIKCEDCNTHNPSSADACTKCGCPLKKLSAVSTTPPNPYPDSVATKNYEGDRIENLSLWGYHIKCFKKFITFKGRARRMEFGGFVLFNLTNGLCNILLTILVTTSDGSLEGILLFPILLSFLYGYASIIPFLAVMARRLQDINYSGWNVLWIFTIICFVPLCLWLLIKEGTPNKNRFGPNPKLPKEIKCH